MYLVLAHTGGHGAGIDPGAVALVVALAVLGALLHIRPIRDRDRDDRRTDR